MKKIYLLLMVLAVLTSCNKEDSAPTNNITYDGKSYDISKGYNQYFGELFTDIYEYDLWLVSENITLNLNGDVSGTGNAAFMALLSSSPTEIVAGTYTFSNSLTTAKTFAIGSVGLDYDIANETGTSLDLVGGTVEVSKDGTTYKIKLDGVMASGKTVTANYSGTLIYYDLSNF